MLLLRAWEASTVREGDSDSSVNLTTHPNSPKEQRSLGQDTWGRTCFHNGKHRRGPSAVPVGGQLPERITGKAIH